MKSKAFLSIFFPLFLLLIVSNVLAGEIGEGLQQNLTEKPSQEHSVIVIMKDRVEKEKLEKFKRLPKHLRRERVIECLKEKSRKTQGNLLRSLRMKFGCEKYTSLWIINAIVAELKATEIHVVSRREDVDEVILNKVAQATLREGRRGRKSSSVYSFEDTTWGLKKVKAPQIWRDFGLTGRGVLIGILDTGIDFHHPDLKGRVWKNTDEVPYDGVDNDGNGYVDDYYGYNFADSTKLSTDNEGHGTHVTGTSAGDGTQGTLTGVAPQARYMPCKVLDEDGSGEESDAWEALQYAIDMDADVLNMSIGWRYDDDPDRGHWREVVNNVVAAGLIVVVAAGNEGMEEGAPDNLRTPGDVPKALTVGAVERSEHRTPFSSVGPVSWEDVPTYSDYPYPPGLIKPDVMAPGMNVNSTVLGSGYEEKDGTSMASPHVAGVAALMLQADSTLVQEDVKGILMSTAIDLGPTGLDSSYGAGLVDPYSAIDSIYGPTGFLQLETPPNTEIFIPKFDQLLNTSTSGTLTFRHLADSSFKVVFRKFGFYPETSVVFIPPSDTFRVPISLDSLPTINVRYQVYEFRSGSLVAEPSLSIVNSDTSSFSSDSGGIIVLNSVPVEDTIKFQITAPGYEKKIYRRVFSETDEGEMYYAFLHKGYAFEETERIMSSTGDWSRGSSFIGPDLARSGSNLWATQLSTDYSNSSDSKLYSPYFSVPDTGSPYFALWHWYNCEATSWGWWDGGNVSVARRGVEEIVYPLSWYDGEIDDYNSIIPFEPAFSGSTRGQYWHQTIFPLSKYRGEDSLRIVFHFGSDDNTTRPGWYLDDLIIAKNTIRGPLIKYSPTVSTIPREGVFQCTTRVIPVLNPLDTSRVRIIYNAGSLTDTLPLYRCGVADSFCATLDSLPSATVVNYYFEAYDSAGYLSRLPKNAPEEQFEFVVDNDTLAPEIEFIQKPLKQIIATEGPFQISSIITDDYSLDTTSIDLIWFKNESTDVRNTAYSERSDSLFKFQIEHSASVGDTFFYRCKAMDGSADSNVAYWPRDSFLHFTIVESIRFSFNEAESILISQRDVWTKGRPTHFPAHSPASCWGTQISGDYPAGASDVLLTPEISLRGLEAASFKLWSKYYFSDSVDGGNIKIYSSDSITALAEPYPSGYSVTLPLSNPFLAGEFGFTGVDSSWKEIVVNLGDYTGEKIRVGFVFGSDSSASTDLGWYIDDLQFNTYSAVVRSSENFSANDFEVMESYPNPFQKSTTIKIRVSKKMETVQLKVYNIAGEPVKEIKKHDLSAGMEEFHWDGRDRNGAFCPSGLYFFRLVSEEYRTGLNKIILIR